MMRLFSITKTVLQRYVLKSFVLIVGLLFVTINSADAVTCTQREFRGGGTWTINSGASITNNSVVGYTYGQGQILIYGATAGQQLEIYGGTWNTSLGVYNTIPIDVPGLGLRAVWDKVDFLTGGVSVVSSASSGSTISDFVRLAVVRTDGTVANPQVYSWVRFELVITDASLYKGGSIQFTGGQAFIFMSGVGAAGCLPDQVSAMADLKGDLPAPVLPTPDPTCTFDVSTLSQSVTMDPVNSSSVPADTDVRAGFTEKPFFIRAYECSANTQFKLYFTDASSSGAQRKYLAPTVGSTVGVRLYHGNESSPIEFGPAPTGSNTPPQTPVSVGPVQGTIEMPFYAQYTRVPGVAANQVEPGATGAVATVTVVYP